MALFRNTAWVLATSIASMPIYFANSVVLARFLSVEDRGLYGVAIAFIGMTALLAELGWGPATIFRLRRASVAPREVEGASLAAMAIIGVLVIAVGFALQDWLAARLNAPSWVVRLAVLGVPLQALWVVQFSIARGIDRFPLQNRSQLLLYAGRLAGMTVVLVWLGGALHEALLVYVIVQLFVLVGLTASILRQTGLARPRPAEMRAHLTFGLGAYAARISGQIHERVDVFMIAAMLGDPKQVAYYAVGVALLSQLKMLPEAMALALYPQLAGTDADHVGALAARVSRHSFFWVLLVAVVTAPVAWLAIPWVYGQPYVESVAPFLILLPGMVLFTRYRLLSNYFSSIDYQRPNIVIQVFTTALNVALNYWWIPIYGIVGSALASLTSYGIAAVLTTAAFMHHSGVGIRETLFFTRSDLDPYLRRLEQVRRRAGALR